MSTTADVEIVNIVIVPPANSPYTWVVAKRTKQPSGGAWWDAWRGVVFAQARVLQAVEPALEKGAGISLAFLDVLARLYDAPERRLRMQELAERSLFTRSGMTRLVDRIEAGGLARRESVPGDRRGVFVILTREGERVLESAMAQHQADVERVFASRLTAEQHRAVADALAQFWRD